MRAYDDHLEQPPAAGKVGITCNTKQSAGCGLRDEQAEYDRPETVRAIQKALEDGGFRTVCLEADATLPQTLARERVDFVFNIAEGIRGRGREAEVPALLNLLNIPFTGSDETAMAIALDKELCKRVMSTCGIATPHFATVLSPDDPALSTMQFPVIVKPNAEGSSKGIPDVCVAADAQTLHRLLTAALELYGESMLVEEYIHGREFTVGILGNGTEARAFAPMEICFHDKTNGYQVYSYDVKQDWQRRVHYECPANLTGDQSKELEALALRAFHALGCHDFARIDFRMDQSGKFWFIEMNPLPGLAPGYSDFPILAALSGVDYGELVRNVLHAALRRLGMQAAAAG
jgi:D-alanine-D-alanine ligase